MSAHNIGDTLVVTLAGELTVEARAALAAVPDRWLSDATRHVVVDVGGVEFCDAAGLRLLLRAWLVSTDHGATFTLRRPSDHLCWLLDLTGTTALLLTGVEKARVERVGVKKAGTGNTGIPKTSSGDEEKTRLTLTDMAGNDHDRDADDGEKRLNAREHDLDDRELVADERDRLLDERNSRVRAHQQWEDIREDLADEREQQLERREHHLPADPAQPEC